MFSFKIKRLSKSVFPNDVEMTVSSNVVNEIGVSQGNLDILVLFEIDARHGISYKIECVPIEISD